ncbi:MAG TPA: tetratricopeptide repeat protein [Chitinophagaceae bacterium]|nr:tetratricopeptide repeat protein [Chitinophagaceae bacterium]
MGKKQWILAIAGLIVVAAIYAFGERVAQTGQAPAVKMATNGAKMSESQGRLVSFDEILTKAKKSIPSDAQLRVTQLENNITRGDLSRQKIRAYNELAKVWDSLGHSSIAAYYKGEQGKLENSEKTLTFAAYLLLTRQESTTDPSISKWELSKAKSFLMSAKELNPQSDSVKVGLAKVDVASGSVMKGVQRLLEVVKHDPKNIAANMTLGRMSITSAQFMKAVKRLEVVVDQQPHNVEALYYLAEAYKNTGDKEKAIALFNKCKDLVHDSGFDQEIDDYINSFK